MRSTFMGLEVAKRGMYTQQSALYVTGHNISNANTPGYSRQRVNFQTTEPYPAVGLNRPNIPGQMGTGVEAASVQRIRDSFIDQQYRGENTKLGYWSARSDALTKVEDIVNEPTEDGLAAVMSEMWQSLQDLAGAPENEGARGVVIERIQSVTDTFNYMSDSLKSVQLDFGNQVNVTIKAANAAIAKLHDINQQIKKIEPNGYLPNDLYDQRDLLVDELSQYFALEVTQVKSGGNAMEIAEGVYEVSMMNADGSKVKIIEDDKYFQIGFKNTADNKMMNGVPDVNTGISGVEVFMKNGSGEWVAATLGDTTAGSPPADVSYTNADGSAKSTVNSIDFADDTTGLPTFAQGELRGLVEGYGYKKTSAATEIKGIYPDMLDELDQLAVTLAAVFNAVHAHGKDLDQTTAAKELFSFDGPPAITTTSYKGAASAIQLTAGVTGADIAASVSGDAGDGRNALNLANVSSMLLNQTTVELIGGGSVNIAGMNLPITSGSVNSFYEGVIGRLGVDSGQALRMEQNTGILRESVETNRQSMSSVSLDEEMTNLIKFQHAYNAAARNITIVDEMLDKIINGMGVAGR
ncbi:flagellar hook-associated protein FlgK [Domibacillus antri]|uniref:Flagellar hook-associated protein 1 n=1 Tax=Domibacillus antri TaxID=1714264 RepID=A0A1Q8Q9Q9_9BACI|nr:flagellar hook-associated protein FlgK [Domibacillus antri]OLN24041.1 flagellar hook-associated protein FlgK [Domibacillus antri]